MPTRRFSPYFPILFLLADLLCLNLAVFCANELKFDSFIHVQDYHFELQILLTAIWCFVFFSAGLQDIHREQRLIDHLNVVLSALVINLAVVFALWFAVNPEFYSRQHLFYTYLFFTLYIIGWRSVWYYFIRYSRTKGYNIRNVLLVGNGEIGQEMIYLMHNNKELGYNYLGIFDNSEVDRKARRY